MERSVSAAEANRRFSRLLKDVKEGNSFVVTSHGKPVAKLVPMNSVLPDAAMLRARKALFARLKSQPAMNIAKWTRDELYEDEP